MRRLIVAALLLVFVAAGLQAGNCIVTAVRGNTATVECGPQGYVEIESRLYWISPDGIPFEYECGLVDGYMYRCRFREYSERTVVQLHSLSRTFFHREPFGPPEPFFKVHKPQ